MNRKQRRAAGKQGQPALLAEAMRHHQAGRLAEAEAGYRRILATRPDDAETQSDLGNALLGQGKLDDAVAAYRRVTALTPVDAMAHSNLGVALRRQGDLQAASTAYRRAIEIDPGYAEAHSNLGSALLALDLRDEAAAAYRRAIDLKPGFADAHSHLGVVLLEQGRREEAEASFRRAIALNPGYAEAHSNLGNALRAQGKLDEAVAAYRRAVGLWPAHYVAHANLGDALRALGRLREAAAACRRSIGLEPGYAPAHSNLGNALQDQGLLDEAVAAFRRAIEISPDYHAAHSNLLMAMHYASSVTGPELHAEALAFGRRHDRPRGETVAHGNVRDPDRRLRIGYVSADFRNHPVGYFLARVLASHDHAAVAVHCYASQTDEDAMTVRLRACADEWRSIAGLSDRDAAALIRQDGIDVLVDLGGHTANNRLTMFALRPAPVQVSWLGYFDTTGLAAMDTILADCFVAPEGEEDRFTETVWRLPGFYLCYAPHDVPASVVARPALADGVVTFGCFNNRAKITDETIRLWADIMGRLPAARLFLKNRSLDDAAVAEALAGRFATLGVARERLILEGQSPIAEMLAAYRRVDIALDPLPFGGGTTTAEALLMGIPVVTLRGDRWVGRMSGGMLTTIGLPELVAGDAESYVRVAVTLAEDPARLAALHGGLRRMVEASPLCDGPGFVAGLEAAFRGMWCDWCGAGGASV